MMPSPDVSSTDVSSTDVSSTDALMLLGKSRRIKDKPFTLIGNRPLFSYGYNTLKQIFERVYIVCCIGLEVELDKYPCVVTEDLGVGPLGGIYAGAKSSNAEYIFVTGCDMPLLDKENICFLASNLAGDGVVPVNEDGLPEPLHAFYHREKILEILTDLEGKGKISDVIDKMNMIRIPIKELNALSFKNINTKKDLQWFIEFTKKWST